MFSFWKLELLIFDPNIGFLVKSCIFCQLEMSRILKFGSHMMKFMLQTQKTKKVKTQNSNNIKKQRKHNPTFTLVNKIDFLLIWLDSRDFWPKFGHMYSFLQGIRIWGLKMPNFRPRREKSWNSNFLTRSKIPIL